VGMGGTDILDFDELATTPPMLSMMTADSIWTLAIRRAGPNGWSSCLGLTWTPDWATHRTGHLGLAPARVQRFPTSLGRHRLGSADAIAHRSLRGGVPP
jgi:hypothetical protein